MYEYPQGRGSYLKKGIIFIFLVTTVSGILYGSYYFRKEDAKAITVLPKGIVNSKQGLLIHEISSNKSKSSLILSLGDTVQILNEHGHTQIVDSVTHTWYHIKYKNSTGWVLGGFITILE